MSGTQALALTAGVVCAMFALGQVSEVLTAPFHGELTDLRDEIRGWAHDSKTLQKELTEAKDNANRVSLAQRLAKEELVRNAVLEADRQAQLSACVRFDGLLNLQPAQYEGVEDTAGLVEDLTTLATVGGVWTDEVKTALFIGKNDDLSELELQIVEKEEKARAKMLEAASAVEARLKPDVVAAAAAAADELDVATLSKIGKKLNKELEKVKDASAGLEGGLVRSARESAQYKVDRAAVEEKIDNFREAPFDQCRDLLEMGSWPHLPLPLPMYPPALSDFLTAAGKLICDKNSGGESEIDIIWQSKGKDLEKSFATAWSQLPALLLAVLFCAASWRPGFLYLLPLCLLLALFWESVVTNQSLDIVNQLIEDTTPSWGKRLLFTRAHESQHLQRYSFEVAKHWLEPRYKLGIHWLHYSFQASHSFVCYCCVGVALYLIQFALAVIQLCLTPDPTLKQKAQ